MMDNYSLSDIRAATGNEGMGGFGGDGLLMLLVLFLFGFGGFGNGFNQHGFGGAATAATQQEILLGQQFDRVEQRLDGIGKGICDSTYALNNSIKECCCNTQLGMKDVAASVHAEGEATRAMIRENEIQTLRDKVSDLQLKASQCDQNAYLVGALKPPCPVPAYLTCSPYQTYNPGCFGCGPLPNI